MWRTLTSFYSTLSFDDWPESLVKVQGALLETEIIDTQSQFSCSVVSDSLQPHQLQHDRPPCPSPTPRVYQNSCPLSQWCHSTISSSVVPCSSCLQSFTASVFFSKLVLPITWPKYWSFSFSISPFNEYSGLIIFRIDSLQSKGPSRVLSNNTLQKH